MSVVRYLMPKPSLRSKLTKTLSASAAMLFAVSLLSIATPHAVSAADPFPLAIFGYVTDSLGDPVVGALVVIKNNDTGFSLDPIITIDDGFYQGNIPEMNWTIGDIISVEATYGGSNGMNETVAAYIEGIPLIEINVTISEAIPEFGTTLGASIAAMIAGAVAIVAVGAPRKKQ